MLDINIFLCLCNVVQHIYFQIILPFFYKIVFENFHSFDASVLCDNVKTPQDHNLDSFMSPEASLPFRSMYDVNYFCRPIAFCK